MNRSFILLIKYRNLKKVILYDLNNLPLSASSSQL